MLSFELAMELSPRAVEELGLADYARNDIL